MNIKDYIENGGVYVDHCFLEPKEFENINEKFYDYEFDAIYQPYGIYYGNRLQAYPVYETKHAHTFDENLDKLIYKKIESIVGKPLQNWHMLLRYTVTEEVLKSKKNTKYHPPHRDHTGVAGMLYFDQTSTGGTAFYRTQYDTVPDIEIGACPNRMVMYSGQMLHSPVNDFTFDKRKTLSFFFDFE